MNNKNNYLDKKFKCLEDCGEIFREEDSGCDGYHRTLIYNHKLLNKNVSTIKDKRCLYNEYNIKFWSDK